MAVAFDMFLAPNKLSANMQYNQNHEYEPVKLKRFVLTQNRNAVCTKKTMIIIYGTLTKHISRRARTWETLEGRLNGQLSSVESSQSTFISERRLVLGQVELQSHCFPQMPSDNKKITTDTAC